MTRSVVELYEHPASPPPDDYPFSLLPTREEAIAQIRNGAPLDVILLGGDLPTAIAAQLLALNGVRVLTVITGPQDTFSCAGLADILELLQSSAREFIASALPRRFAAAAFRRYAPHRAAQLHECIYHAHSLCSELPTPFFAKLRARLAHATLLDDGAAIAEALLAARREGAYVVPYLEPLYLETVGESGIKVLGVRDSDTGDTFEVRAGGVVVARDVVTPQSRLRNELTTPTVANGAGVLHLEARATHSEQSQSGKAFIFENHGQIGIAVPTSSNPGGLSIAVGVSDTSEKGSSSVIQFLQALYQDVRIVARRENAPFSKGAELRHGNGGTILLSSSSPLRAIAQAEKLALLYARAAGRSDREIVLGESLSNPGYLPTIRVGARSPVERFEDAARATGLDEKSITYAKLRWGDRVRYVNEFPAGLSPVLATEHNRNESTPILRGELALAVVADQVRCVADLSRSILRYSPRTDEERLTLQHEIQVIKEEATLARRKNESD